MYRNPFQSGTGDGDSVGVNADVFQEEVWKNSKDHDESYL